MAEPIYCQKAIPKEQWRYGLRSSAATGCGWIAAYNALVLMGREPDPEEIIRAYQAQVPLLHGNAGTLALAPVWYFRSRGFRATHTARYDRFDAMAREAEACVLFYYWRKGCKFGAHFVAVQYREGQFWGYNTYTNSTGPDRYGESLEGFLKERRYFGAVLTCIKAK